MSYFTECRGMGLEELQIAQRHITSLLTETFPAPLLAPSQVLTLRNALVELSHLIPRFLIESTNPRSAILCTGDKAQPNLLLKIASVGLVDALKELEDLVQIQKNAHDVSDLRWHSWVGALGMSKLLGGESDGDDISTLVGVRRRLEEVVWRLQCLYKVLTKSHVSQIHLQLPIITDTLNAVLLNHQCLYFRDDLGFNNSGLRNMTPSMIVNFRAKFGGGSLRSDAGSEFSVETTTTARERMYRNRDALEIDAMIRKFREASTAGYSNNAATTSHAELGWQARAESALTVLMHWVHQAITGLDPFLRYHFYFATEAKHAQGLNALPVPGYVNLIKSAWILQTLEPGEGSLGQEMGNEGRALFGALACEVIDLFQAISENEYDLPSADSTHAQGNFSLAFECPSGGQMTPTLPQSTNLSGILEPNTVTTLPDLEYRSNTDPSSSSSSGGSTSWEPDCQRGRSDRLQEAPETYAHAKGSQPSPMGRGGVTALYERCGRSSVHWRSISSSFTGTGDRPTSLQMSHQRLDGARPIDIHPAPGLRRPSTTASTTGARNIANGISNLYPNTLSRIFTPFSSSAPVGRGASVVRPRSRSASPGSSHETQSRRPDSDNLQPAASIQKGESPNLTENKNEVPNPSTPTSARSHRFSKLQFQKSKDKSRSGVVSASLVSLTSSLTSPIVGDKSRGVYATNPLPPIPADDIPPTGVSVEGAHEGSRIRTAEGGGGSAHGWSETYTLGSTESNIGIKEGEVEVMAEKMSRMSVLASYAGELHGVRWDECRVRIFTKLDRGHHGEYGTKLRIVTQNMRLQGSIDQRILFLNHSELVPEYAYHDDNFVPILFLRKIVGPRVIPGGGSNRLSKWQGEKTVNGNKNFTTTTTKEWDNCSLYYRFRSLQDMLNFQFVLLGEAVKTDICSIATIRYKRTLLDGEHTHYRARTQIWHQNFDSNLETVADLHAKNLTLTSGTTSGGQALRVEGNSDTAPSCKVYTYRLVIYWENGGGVVLFLTDSIEIEQRTSRGNNSVINTTTLTSAGGSNSPRRPSTITTYASHTTTSTDSPVGSYTLRIKPSSQNSKFPLNQGSIRARLLSPGNTQASGFRLDKHGLRFEDFKNGTDGWDEYRWFEIEFSSEGEMSCFQRDFKLALNAWRRGEERREEISGPSAKANRAPSSSRAGWRR